MIINSANQGRVKDVLRESSSLNEACIKLSKIFKEKDISRHQLRKACLKAGLSSPSTYLNDGVEASKRGDHPKHNLINDQATTAPGYMIRGVSTQYKADGSVGVQWVKTKTDLDAQLDMLREAVMGIAEPIKGCSKVMPAAKTFIDDLLCVYPMGDPHIGLYAWHQETGEDFDLKIAERDLVGAVDYLVEQAVPARQAIIVNLGDFFHSDNLDNRTRRSGHVLDVDGRFPKVLAIGLRTIRRCIDKALDKHESVKVINAIGNHDDHTSMMLSITLAAYYENNPRVTVDTSPAAHHFHRFGKVLLGVTHGHTSKPERLQGVMTVDRAKDWGETLHRHWLTGHVHHDQKKELSGCTFESFRTLAAKDAYAASHGYRSERDMKCITYHAEYGEVYRHTANIRLVRALLK